MKKNVLRTSYVRWKKWYQIIKKMLSKKEKFDLKHILSLTQERHCSGNKTYNSIEKNKQEILNITHWKITRG